MDSAEEEFKVTCSDEEVAGNFNESHAGWAPKPEKLIWLYETIKKDNILPLKWKCEYGKRLPTPSQEGSDSEDEEDDEKVEIAGFDFDDEMSTPKLTPRRTPGALKGSAKKKTTNFENVLASVRRQKNLEAREKFRNKRERKQ